MDRPTLRIVPLGCLFWVTSVFRPRRRVERLRYAGVIVALITACAFSSTSKGQQRRGRTRTGSNGFVVPSVLLEPSPPVVNLFSRAEKGIARADWKFAIDCLQRIIDEPGSGLMLRLGKAADGATLYESARRRAIRSLAALPPEGLRAYRLLYDGKAKGLLERAKAAHDPQRLRVVVERYLLTRYGDDAADLLASWELDAGRWGETVILLTDLLELAPDYDVPDRLIKAKLAAAYSLLGRTGEAASVVETYLPSRGAGADGHGDGFADSLLALRPTQFDRTSDPNPWPLPGGTAARRSLMPAVEPTLTDAGPWRLDLPGAAADAWRRVFNDDPNGPLVLPVVQLISDGRRLYVRTLRGCVAADAEDLAVRWEAVPEMIGVPTQAAASAESQSRSYQSARSPSDAEIAYEDHVVGGISLGHGLVMAITREGITEYRLARRDADRQRLLAWLPRPAFARSLVSGTRLVAFDAKTGKTRWERGRTGNSRDPLGDVEFRSVPIEVGNALWVPVLRQDDLSVAVLDPADGALVHHVPLCSLSNPQLDPGHALQPAAAGGLVYVPSGHGVLFAIDAGNYTVRWASQYVTDLQAPQAAASSGATVWLPSPPVVSAGIVLLAPTEHTKLLALSAYSGELRWSADGGNGSYILAADHDHVWLGGRSVSCLSLSDGKPIWKVGAGSAPTGRAAMSGGTILLPTLDGLLSLDAVTGETLSKAPLPGSQPPLGNLLCLSRAMYSIDPSGVRKHLDIGRAYPAALAQHLNNPSDISVSIRLAWLELLRDRPQEAYDVLNAIPRGLLEHDATRAGSAARVRVEALLALAGRSARAGTPDQHILAMLEEAGRAARSASDRLRCGMAVADHLDAMGRCGEAYRRLWQLGISADADQVVPLREHVEGLSRFDLSERLLQLAPRLTSEEQQHIREHTRAETEHLALQLRRGEREREARARLRAVADLQGPGTTRQLSLIELASYEAKRLRYEHTEQLLRECVRLDAEAVMTLAARMQLCELHAVVFGGAGFPLRRDLDELDSRFGGSLVPKVFRPLHPAGEPRPQDERVVDWVARMRLELPDATSTRVQGSEEHASFVLTSARDAVWSVVLPSGRPNEISAPFALSGELGPSLAVAARSGAPRLVHIESGGAAAFPRRAVFHGPGDVLYCQHVQTGQLLWHTALQLSETSVTGDDTRWARWVDRPRRAVVDGQTAVFNGSEGLFAVGLVTGRRIWARAYESFHTPYDRPMHDMAMAAGDGLLAAVPRAGWLTLMRMLDGSTVWERDLRGEQVDRIWMRGDRVLTADARLERVHVFDRYDGVLIKRILFEQPDPDNPAVEPICTAGILAGPTADDHSEGVLAVNVDTGKTAWRMDLDKPLGQLFKPAEGYVGIGLLGGDLRVVDAVTGDLVIDRRIGGAHAVAGGVLMDGTLLVAYYAEPDRSRSPELTALDVATGSELWRRADSAPLARVGEPVRVIGGQVPVVIYPLDRRARRRGAAHLAMVDLRTGVGTAVEVPPLRAHNLALVDGDFEVFPESEVAILRTPKAIHALRIEAVDHSTQEGL